VGGTSAPTVHDLTGLSGLAGSTVNVGPISGTAEGLFGRTPAGAQYGGGQVGVGGHLPLLGVEVHGAATGARVWAFNLFDLWPFGNGDGSAAGGSFGPRPGSGPSK
jgi:hypothetical protein